MKTNDKYREIFLTAHRLFLSQGYEAATVRQISELAGVSLGLTNHFFRSKQELAGLTLDMLSSYTAYYCRRQRTSMEPLVHELLLPRVCFLYLSRGNYRQFYLECLRHDVCFHRLEANPDRTLYELSPAYDFPADDDLFLLYGTYVPYNCEKTLTLGKEHGLFPTISWEDIPDYVAISKFEHFLDPDVLNQALAKAHDAAETVLARIPDTVSDQFLHRFLDEVR